MLDLFWGFKWLVHLQDAIFLIHSILRDWERMVKFPLINDMTNNQKNMQAYLEIMNILIGKMGIFGVQDCLSK